jgi:Trk K+ transport system NAD-binding subunit
MRKVIRRAGYYLLFIATLIIVASLLYDGAMKAFEPGPYPPPGTEISLLHSMQVVVETFTATGYGSDSPWKSPEMNVLVILLDILGVGLFFLALPAVLLPLFQDALSPSVPTAADGDLGDHVVISAYTARAEALIDELVSNDVEYILLEPDRERAAELYESGYSVVHADAQSVEDLRGVNLSSAKALVADVSDRVDASIVLAAKEAAEEVDVVSVVEEPDLKAYHRLAGADRVLTPRQLLGERLAEKLTTGVRAETGDAIGVGDDFEIAELPVRRGSDLSGATLADSGLRERFGVNVIGAWFNGEFNSPAPLETPLESGTVLLVTGERDQLERLRESTYSTVRRFTRGETIVVGYGAVGKSAIAALEEAGLPYTVVDTEAYEQTDVVGDVTEPETLEAAGIESAQSILFALPDDTATEFATLVVRDLDPSTEIVARAERAAAVPKTYRAGADYVLSLATVSGRSIASYVLDGEEILSVDTNVEVVRTTAPGLAGETIRDAGVRERTGCTIVAVERDGTVITDIEPEFQVRGDDEVIVAGTDAGTTRFTERYG